MPESLPAPDRVGPWQAQLYPLARLVQLTGPVDVPEVRLLLEAGAWRDGTRRSWWLPARRWRWLRPRLAAAVDPLFRRAGLPL